MVAEKNVSILFLSVVIPRPLSRDFVLTVCVSCQVMLVGFGIGSFELIDWIIVVFVMKTSLERRFLVLLSKIKIRN